MSMAANGRLLSLEPVKAYRCDDNSLRLSRQWCDERRNTCACNQKTDSLEYSLFVNCPPPLLLHSKSGNWASAL
jgi:hypothetical protein